MLDILTNYPERYVQKESETINCEEMEHEKADCNGYYLWNHPPTCLKFFLSYNHDAHERFFNWLTIKKDT